jgi:hypothetical protein
VGVVVAAGDRAAVRVRGPGVGVSVVAGEVGDHVAALFVCGTTESDVFDFSGLAGGRCGSSQEGQRLGGLEHDLQVRAQLVGHSDSVPDEIDRSLNEGSQ